jgi:Cu2+-exporting ATPase
MTECTLCGLAVPDPPITADDVDGVFCCRGCLQVARTIDEVPIEDAEPDDVLDGGEVDDTAGEVAYLSIDGMHCATCELFLESTATDHDGITGAAASYATDTMKLVYDPERLSEEELPDIVSGMGYSARERTVDTEPESDDAQIARFLAGGGFFGMMTMLFYGLFIYPQHFGFDPVVEFGTFGRLYLLGQLWLFATAVLWYTGRPILRGAYVSLRAGQPNMDLLVALAASSAYVYSTAVALTGGIDVYFDVTVAIILVVTAGNYYEDRVKRSAIGHLSDLTADRVSHARLRSGETVPIDEIEPQTELLVRPGERIPLDGTVVEGVAAVDEALVTGESLPVTKRPGEDVVGGAVVTDAPLVVEVSEDGTSTLDRIVGLLWDIQSSRPTVQKLADKLATIFVPLVTVVAVVVAGVTVALGGTVGNAVLVGLTVLIVSCPCALGLATPLAVAAGVGRATEDGVVVASETLFETLPDTEVVALDKTGTLTTGEMTVDEADAGDEALARAATLERYSTHPVADAVLAYATDKQRSAGDRTPRDEREQITDGGTQIETTGGSDAASVTVETKGVVGTIDGDETVVGHPDLFDERDWTVSKEYRDGATAATESGAIPVYVGWDGDVRGLFVVRDDPRATWVETVETLSAADREIVILTGDESAAAEQFRDHPDVSDVFTGVPPDGKAAAVERLRQRGQVTMVGDGTNDAPALAAADVGIAIAEGTKLAADAADAVVTNGRLDAVPTLFDVARATRRRVRQNLGWAFCYNAVAIPLAASGLLNPLFAALAMTASSTLVVLNSSRALVPSE